ncbi:gamma-glutamyltranspeptidase precursor [Helicobacter mustelae]|uniref:gamma-glutamyltransferase n=1 Tax=Helicobacter mustelae TaxID=217 RepID=UPI000DFDACEA|nr:gamma-glutamyltransferase [Helicobacter mustelae]STP12698.1 gamma-glutamyltranspeptidase precursor [Helicobacter mustelae]
MLAKGFVFKTLVIGISAMVLSWGAAPAPYRSKNGIVVTSHPLASKIGQDVLNAGGNAIDAAVAVGYALAVVHPAAGNIGGGGFAIIHLKNGKNLALDFRETAPLAATRDMYLDAKGNVIKDASVFGYLAAGVPGTVAGMSAMLEKYGTKKLADLLAPSIKLAQNGYRVSYRQEQTFAKMKEQLQKFASTRKYFFKPDGSTYKAGDLLVQKDLANTLRLIAKDGPDAFYKGPIADKIAEDMKKNKGIMTKKDLASYKVTWREPVRGTYRGYEIISMSPPSSGGVHLIQMLNVLENANIKQMGFGSSDTIHLMAEAMRQAYADRSEYLGDPDFIKVPVKKLIDKAYAKSIYSKITPNATPSTKLKPGLGSYESNQTTHYSVVDKMGNAVSVTYTINGSYGSGAAVNHAGFLLNNEMDDFSIKPGVANLYGLVGGDANAIAPKKRPLSSMTPTIVLKDNKPFMVVGSPGGARIITTVLQVIVNVIDHDMNISEAILAPRFHNQWLPDEIRLEKYAVPKDVADALEKKGHKLSIKAPMGDVNGIVVLPNGEARGMSDPRREF